MNPPLGTSPMAIEPGRMISAKEPANIVTTVRSVISICLAAGAFAESSFALLFAALLVHWVGDTLDGIVARRIGKLTTYGASFDIVADRVCIFFIVVAAWPILSTGAWFLLFAFALMYSTIDYILSFEFDRFSYQPPTPNQFYLVDANIFLANWSRVSKVIFTTPIVLSAMFERYLLAASIWLAVDTAIKSGSLVLSKSLAASVRNPKQNDDGKLISSYLAVVGKLVGR